MLQPTMHSRANLASSVSRRVCAGMLPTALFSLALLVPAALPAQTVFATGVSTPPAGTYDRTLALHFTASFSAPVVVRGAPRLTLQVGDQVRHATWMPPLGPSPATTELTFVYHPEPLDQDEDGIVVLAGVDLNGGAIQGPDTSPAQLSFPAPHTAGIRIALQLPPAPRLLGLTSGTDTTPGGVAAGNAFVLRGTADGGSVVTVTLAQVGPLGSVAAEPNGAWSMPYPDSWLSPGIHRLTATAENSAGLVSAPSEPLELRVSGGPAREEMR